MNIFFEKTLEEILFENKDTLHQRGFIKFYKNSERQFYLPSGKRIDIFNWEIVDGNLFGRIIELKREDINISCYCQALDYWAEITSIICGYFKKFKIEIVLVGTAICDNVVYASHLTDLLLLYSYKFDYYGISFVDWTIPNSKIIEMMEDPMPKEANSTIQNLIQKLKTNT